MIETDVAIVGAGPAGLACASVLGAHGVATTVLDEQARAGGQIYRQPAGPRQDPDEALDARDPGTRLRRAARHDSVRWLQHETVWGIFSPAHAEGEGGFGLVDALGSGVARGDGLLLAIHGERGARAVRARRVLLAPGAYDRPVAFPGWTLPGVLPVGGAQAFLKSQGLATGRRFVLAGTHPLLIVFAAQLLRAGAEVAAIATPHSPGDVRRLGRPGVALANLDRAGDLVAALRTVRRHRVPWYWRHTVAAAEGDERLERVRVVGVGEAAAGRQGGGFVAEADALALGFGFLASSELARQAGCRGRWDLPRGGWLVEHDAWMRSSRADISVAGEITGVAGADVAEAEGRLAGIGILRDAGLLPARTAARAARGARRVLRRRQRLASALAAFAAVDPSLVVGLLSEETVLCRCEGVTVGGLAEQAAGHPALRTMDAVKLRTRVGMGMCQGRYCWVTLAHLMAAERGMTIPSLGGFRVRPPVKPVPLGDLADLADAAEQ